MRPVSPTQLQPLVGMNRVQNDAATLMKSTCLPDLQAHADGKRAVL